jgi:hypothetical protein
MKKPVSHAKLDIDKYLKFHLLFIISHHRKKKATEEKIALQSAGDITSRYKLFNLCIPNRLALKAIGGMIPTSPHDLCLLFIHGQVSGIRFFNM